MSRSPRVLFVSYGGGHIGMVLPVIRELEALIPAVQCELMALTTGHLKAKAIRPEALGYKDFLHLVDRSGSAKETPVRMFPWTRPSHTWGSTTWT